MGTRLVEALLRQADGSFYNYASGVAPSGFVLGVTKPDATTNGPNGIGIRDADLVDITGDVSLATGQTMIGKRIHGAVHYAGNNALLRGCKVVGRPGATYSSSYRGLITNDGGTGNVAEYCELTQYDTSTSSNNSIYWREGVYMTGGTLTTRRCDINNANHLYYITGGTLRDEASWLHDTSYRTDDADHSSDSRYPYGSHNDLIHFAGGSDHHFEGTAGDNTFSTVTGMASTLGTDGAGNPIYPNAHCILARQANSTLPRVTLKNLWLKHGSIALQFTTSTLTGGGADWSITGLKITPDQGQEYSYYQQITIDAGQWGAIVIDSSNVYSDDPDTPLAWRGQPLKAPTGTNPKSWAFNATAHTP